MTIKEFFLSSNFSSTLLISFIITISIVLDKNNESSNLIVPAITGLLITYATTNWGIPKLKQLKLNQVIRREGPKQHLKKDGTPTLGGLFVIPTALIISNIACLNSSNNKEILLITFLILSQAAIGLIDDWRSFTLQKNIGLTAKAKLTLQIIAGISFLLLISFRDLLPTYISLHGYESINTSFFIWPLALFIILAESNATNLTDGLDGLASGIGSIIFTGLAIELSIRGTANDFAYATLCITFAGSFAGFLIHNKNPAKIFMGDTGSLAMGAALSGTALLSNSLWALLIMGFLLVVESLSVILQVSFFKITKKIYGKGKRILLMAPLHHHFELLGKSEQLIVSFFWLANILLVIIGLIFRSST